MQIFQNVSPETIVTIFGEDFDCLVAIGVKGCNAEMATNCLPEDRKALCELLRSAADQIQKEFVQ